jgi:hypothetical protein
MMTAWWEKDGRDPSMPHFNPAFAAELRTRLRQAVESYVARGRRFAELDDEALSRRYVLAVKAWCVHRRHPDVAREVNEVSAEYLFRRRDVPIELIKDDVVAVLEGCGQGWGAERKYPKSLDEEPVVTIAVVALNHPWLFAPFRGALLGPNPDRYGY